MSDPTNELCSSSRKSSDTGAQGDNTPKISPGRKTLFVAILLLIALASAELVVRVRDMAVGYGFFNSRRNKLYNTPDAVIPFRTFGVRPYVKAGVISDRWGREFALPKSGAFRIVCMGGSTTEEKRDDGFRWPSELERILRERLNRPDIEVMNLGNSAYATPHLLIHLELDVLSWQPDLIIAFENINDLQANWFPDFKPDYSHMFSDPYFNTPDFSKNFTLAAALLQHFQLYWIVKDRIDRFDVAGNYRIRREPWGDKPLPGLPIFERNWRSFAALARSNGIPLVLASQPFHPSEQKFDLHARSKPYNHKIRYPLPAEVAAQHKSYNDVIRRVARDSEALFVDSDAALAANDEFFYDHVHYTTLGARRLAQNFADALIAAGIFK